MNLRRESSGRVRSCSLYFTAGEDAFWRVQAEETVQRNLGAGCNRPAVAVKLRFDRFRELQTTRRDSSIPLRPPPSTSRITG